MEPVVKVQDLEEGRSTDTSEEKERLFNDSNKLNMDNLGNSEETPLSSAKYSEPELITNNAVTFGHFRRLGIFLPHWSNGKYKISNRKLLCYYFLWYLGGAAIFVIAFILKEYFKPKDFKDRVNNYIEASFVGIFVGILPACAIYLMKEYSNHLPQILMGASKFEETEFYKELKKPEYLDDSKIYYRDGFLADDHDDKDDEINIECGLEKSEKEQWCLVRYGPLVGIILSFATCITLILLSIFTELHKDKALARLKKELPVFIIAVFYPFKAYTSLWFCIFFLEWQRRIYTSIREFIRKNGKESGSNIKKEFRQVIDSVKILQKVFLLLNRKIFQKTIVMDFSLFIIMGVYISWKIIKDSHNFAYIFPLGLILGHIYLICKWSNDLMSEYNETIEVLNEMNDEDVKDLRTQLQTAPPQVRAFGGFETNYSMMTAVIAFMLSIISITGMVWPDTVAEKCYQYKDEYGINQTICINDEGLFRNGSLESNLIVKDTVTQ